MIFIELFEGSLTYDNTFTDISPDFIRNIMEVKCETDRVGSWDGDEFRGFLTLSIF